MRLDIVYWPDPVLLKPTEPVQRVDDAVRKTVAEMRRIMFKLKGVGLAAPQVRIQRQIMLVCPSGAPGDETVVLNPQILEGDGVHVADEGCLSLPGVFGPVARNVRVRVRYQDLDLRTYEVELSEFEARVFQHEYDHLQGTMFIDRMEASDREGIEPELDSFRQDFAAASADAAPPSSGE